jgi:hypothetical protein
MTQNCGFKVICHLGDIETLCRGGLRLLNLRLHNACWRKEGLSCLMHSLACTVASFVLWWMSSSLWFVIHVHCWAGIRVDVQHSPERGVGPASELPLKVHIDNRVCVVSTLVVPEF